MSQGMTPEFAAGLCAMMLDGIQREAECTKRVLAAVPDDAWDRTGTRRDGEVFTVLGAGRFALHEGTHHLLDIGRVMRAARGR